MINMYRQTSYALTTLFTTRKTKLVLLFLVLLASLISVSELLVTHLFTSIILDRDPKDVIQTQLNLFLLFLFLALTRLGHYLQRIYRLKLFKRSFEKEENSKTQSEQSWQWALAFELSTILGVFLQLIAMAIFFAFLNFRFALINLIIVIVVLQLISRLFSKQVSLQKTFHESTNTTSQVPNSEKVITRIKSGEIGTLISGASFLLLIGLLIFFAFDALISPAHSIVLFFGIKIQSTSLSTLSTSLMRFARARAKNE